MKTKLYPLITGLLMAACITSYGQEIVSEFYYTCDKAFSYNDLVTCSDGSIISGIYCYNPNTYEVMGFHVCKFSPDGHLLDTATFASAWELYDIPDTPDTYFLPDYYENEVDNTMDIVLTFIDADLNIINTVTTPVLSGIDSQTFEADAMCVSPEGDLITTFWVDGTFHLARIGLNGSLKAYQTAPEVLPYNWTYTQPADSALNYESFGVFDESPECFYKLGGYIGDDNEPWPLIVYLFDTKLTLTDTIVFCDLDETHYCDFGSREHIVPLKGNPSTGSHVMAANIHFPNETYSTSLIKYDADNNPITFTSIAPSSVEYSVPVNTIVTANNQIYHTYEAYSYDYNNPIISLAHLDEDLNVVWNINLPQMLNPLCYGATLKVLPNGDIAVSMASYRGFNTRLYIFIVHDNDPTRTPETAATEKPFEFYPNPVKDMLSIHYSENTKPASVELYDITGRLVGTKRNSLECIDMSALPTGVYMLCATMKDGTSYREKILKE